MAAYCRCTNTVTVSVTYTSEEQRYVNRFLRSEGVKPTENHRRMNVEYGDACLPQQQVYKWSRKFANGVTSVEDAPRPGQVEVVTTQNHQQTTVMLVSRRKRKEKKINKNILELQALGTS